MLVSDREFDHLTARVDNVERDVRDLLLTDADRRGAAREAAKVAARAASWIVGLVGIAAIVANVLVAVYLRTPASVPAPRTPSGSRSVPIIAEAVQK